MGFVIPDVMSSDFERCYRAVQSRDAAIRRMVLHSGHVDGHLLPAQLPGDDAEARKRPLLPDGRGRTSSGLPSVSPVPSGCHSGFARVEHACRSRRPRDAPHRGRRRRPRRRSRARPPARLQRAPSQPPAHSRGRRRTHRPRSSTARPERARAHRDDRAPIRARGLRRGLREHPPVQRHDPRDLRDHPERDACGSPEPRPGAIRSDRPAAAMSHPLRRRRGPRVPRGTRSAWHRRGVGHHL